ncbi:MAG: BtpA/SgcQ family protein [Chloroflexi bacterium]|nr:BtpA/SgcQ family protein [Chloroflexota bacterium]MCI0864462.1 BtpA/SgcQ family protein [Chloroflexota bacterium]MCI0904365.1 BtpA/SgcQ family protein [Chloroflexota bacterium]
MSRDLFGPSKAFIGVVHLLPLPGSPRWGGDMRAVIDRAEDEANILEQGGVDGIIVENFGDAPFRIGRLDPETISGMTVAVDRVQGVVSVPVGINMLRNDARSALGIAAVTGAKFIRVNVHYGVMAAEEGLIEGEAYQTMRHRKYLGLDVKILADVLVKHAVPLGSVDLGLIARETAQRGLADGLIVSGAATGLETASSDVSVVRQAVPDGLVLVGSGVTEKNIWSVIEHSDGAIIGTSLKEDGIVTNRVDPDRVRRMAEIFRSLP